MVYLGFLFELILDLWLRLTIAEVNAESISMTVCMQPNFFRWLYNTYPILFV